MKFIYPIILILLLTRVVCNESKYITDDFLQNLSSENNRIWDELNLEVFDKDFNRLTYNYYIQYLDSK